jgi:hypothetical protein
MFEPFRQSEEHPESEADIALRQSLRLLPVPETSSEFNARVHAALLRPEPWWRILWASARPVLSGAVCSILVMFALLKGLSTTVTTAPRPSHTAALGAVVAARTRERMDELVRSDNLTAASLNGFGALRESRPTKRRPQNEPQRPATPRSRF